MDNSSDNKYQSQIIIMIAPDQGTFVLVLFRTSIYIVTLKIKLFLQFWKFRYLKSLLKNICNKSMEMYTNVFFSCSCISPDNKTNKL